MPSKKGGYKIVSLGGLDLTGENLSLKGLYNALKISYGKPILLNGIVIDGESKKDALVQADEGANVINIKHVYGYNLSVSSADAITVEVDSEGIELPVPTPEDDEKIVGVNVQGKYVLKPSVKEQVEGAESGTIVDALGLNADGKLVKGAVSGGGAKLYEHYLTITTRGENHAVHFINTNAEQYNIDNFKTIGNTCLVGIQANNLVDLLSLYEPFPGATLFVLEYIAIESISIDNVSYNLLVKKNANINNSDLISVSDTVTEL